MNTNSCRFALPVDRFVFFGILGAVLLLFAGRAAQAQQGPAVAPVTMPVAAVSRMPEAKKGGASIAALLDEVLLLEDGQNIAAPFGADARDNGVQAFVRAIDRYGDYLRPEVLASMEQVEHAPYGGIGMEVFWDRDDKMVCIPLPGGPAELSGVTYGQVLTAVAGHDVRLLNMEDVGYLLRGKPGTQVEIAVFDPAIRASRRIGITRMLVRPQTVTMSSLDDIPVVRITKFAGSTPAELAAVLAPLDLGKGLVLDLRGNVGGDLQGAIKAAGFFLDAGMVACIRRGRQGETVFKSEGRRFRPSRLVLWQDHLTASAAEVFSAALLDNRQALAVGLPTFGKGASQLLFKLRNGGGLLVTAATLITPRGVAYDGIGLAPNRHLPRDAAWSDARYKEATREILRGAGAF